MPRWLKLKPPTVSLQLVFHPAVAFGVAKVAM
jgi:hypothetical protein